MQRQFHSVYSLPQQPQPRPRSNHSNRTLELVSRRGNSPPQQPRLLLTIRRGGREGERGRREEGEEDGLRPLEIVERAALQSREGRAFRSALRRKRGISTTAQGRAKRELTSLTSSPSTAFHSGRSSPQNRWRKTTSHAACVATCCLRSSSNPSTTGTKAFATGSARASNSTTRDRMMSGSACVR